MNELMFQWVRGDDEMETLIFTEADGSPCDFSGGRFDLHLVPEGRSACPKIMLSSEEGISVQGNQVTLWVKHEQTQNVDWSYAKWDLQFTYANGLVKTLCAGTVKLRRDITITTGDVNAN